MSLLTVAVIATVIAYVFSSFSKRSTTFPPGGSCVLPWFGTALSYVSSPTEFLTHCQKQYGSTFRMLLGGREVTVVSSAAAISSIYAADHTVLGTREMQNELYHAVSGSKGNSTEVYRVVTHPIFLMWPCWTSAFRNALRGI